MAKRKVKAVHSPQSTGFAADLAKFLQNNLMDLAAWRAIEAGEPVVTEDDVLAVLEEAAKVVMFANFLAKYHKPSAEVARILREAVKDA